MQLRRLFIYLNYSLAFSLSFGDFLSRYILILLVIVSLLLIIREKPRIELSSSMTLNLLPIVLYIILILSRDLYEGNWNGSYIERQLSLPLLVLIFFIARKTHLNITFEKINFYLLSGILISFIVNISISIYQSISYVDNKMLFNPIVSNKTTDFLKSSIYGGNYFMGIHLSHFMHTSYISFLISFSVFYILFTLKKINFLTPLIIVILTLYIFLLSSKAGIFSYLLAVSLSSFTQIRQIKFSRILVVISIFFVAIVMLFSNPRLSTMVKRYYNDGISINKNAKYSFGSRLLVWSSSLELIKENLLVGTSPFYSQSQLDRIYLKNEFETPLKNHYNSHNQFLQVGVEFGLVGIVIFICMLFAPLWYKFRNRLYYVVFLFLLMFNFLFESMLERYQGIVIFAFFYAFFIMGFTNSSDEKSKEIC